MKTNKDGIVLNEKEARILLALLEVVIEGKPPDYDDEEAEVLLEQIQQAIRAAE